jgi:hypothetical protein
MRPARGDIENRLRAHARDRRAADMFQSQRQVPTLAADALFFGGEELGPPTVVLGEPDDARFKAEGSGIPSLDSYIGYTHRTGSA